MSIYLQLIFVTVLIVYIVDLSGFTESWKPYAQALVKRVAGFTPRNVKPFDCSLCLTWWTGLVYIIAAGEFHLATLTAVALLSYSTVIIGQLLMALKGLAIWIINKFSK